MGKIRLWIGNEFKEFDFEKNVKFDGRRIFIDDEIVSDVDDYSISEIIS